MQLLKCLFANSDILGLEGYDKDENKDNCNLTPLHPPRLEEFGNLNLVLIFSFTFYCEVNHHKIS